MTAPPGAGGPAAGAGEHLLADITALIERVLASVTEVAEAMTAVAAAARAGRRPLRRADLATLRPLVAQVVPVVGLANDVLHSVGAIVILTDLETAGRGPAETVLEQAFGFTPAEARLAAQIAAGKTLAEISRQEGSARETLRSRLKTVFEKTGTGRQAELALLLSKVPIHRN